MVRLLGIAIASFSSGLGELTFLQMSTALPTSKFSKVAVGAWSSGTGGAGIAGAGLWWLLRNLGVTKGLGIASFLPLCFPLVLRFLLPPFARVGHIREISSYAPIFAADDDASEVDFPAEAPRKVDLPIHTGLTFADKFELVKPLVFKYMLWLFLVYVFEYIINTVSDPPSPLSFDNGFAPSSPHFSIAGCRPGACVRRSDRGCLDTCIQKDSGFLPFLELDL